MGELYRLHWAMNTSHTPTYHFDGSLPPSDRDGGSQGPVFHANALQLVKLTHKLSTREDEVHVTLHPKSIESPLYLFPTMYTNRPLSRCLYPISSS